MGSSLFQQIRADYVTHGRSLRHRALWALVVYRFGRWAQGLRPSPLRWVTDKLYGAASLVAPIITGVAIDRRMRVGQRFHIVHPGMVLIHPDVTFGDRCGVMHGVTIGTSGGGHGGVPTIGNDVFISAGAVVVGPVFIGDGARVAANSLVVCDVPPGALAIGVPAKVYPQAAAPNRGAAGPGSALPLRPATTGT